VPWQGQRDNLIDRFDVRSILDYYIEPDPGKKETPPLEEQQMEVLLNYERYRSLLESLRLGIEEESWIRRCDQAVMLKVARFEDLSAKLENARSAEDLLETPEEKERERTLRRQILGLPPTPLKPALTAPPGMRGSGSTAAASIRFRYEGTTIVEDSELKHQHDEYNEDDYVDAEGSDASDDDESEEESVSHEEQAPDVDALDIADLPIVLSIDAMEMLGKSHGILGYDRLHEVDTKVSTTRKLKALARMHAHALRRATGLPKGKKLSKAAKRRRKEQMVQGLTEQAMKRMKERREEERRLGGSSSQAISTAPRSQTTSLPSSSRKRRRSQSRSTSPRSQDADGGRHFITSFPVHPSSRPSIGISANEGDDDDEDDDEYESTIGGDGVSQSASAQMHSEIGFFVRPPTEKQIEAFFPDLIPMNARDAEAEMKTNSNPERQTTQSASAAVGRSLPSESKHWAPRRRADSRSPDSPPRPVAPLSASAAPTKLTGAALLKSKMMDRLGSLVNKDAEETRRKRREEALQRREREEEIQRQRQAQAGAFADSHPHSPGLVPPSPPSPSHHRSHSRSRSPSPHSSSSRSRRSSHCHHHFSSSSSQWSRSPPRSVNSPSHRHRSSSHKHSRSRSRSRSRRRSHSRGDHHHHRSSGSRRSRSPHSSRHHRHHHRADSRRSRSRSRSRSRGRHSTDSHSRRRHRSRSR